MKNRAAAIKIMDLMHQEKGFLLTDEAMMIKGEKAILHYLSHHQEEVIAGDLSKALDVSTARIAAVLNRLEQKNYIVRNIDDIDKRKVYVSLTKTGKEYLLASREQVIKLMAKLIEEVGEAKIYEHIMLHSRIKRIMKQEQIKETK